MSAKLKRETYEIIEKKIANADERIKPIQVADIGRRQPLTLLSKRILAWSAHDLRADSYVRNQEPDLTSFKSTDEDLMTDIAEGIELKVVRKDVMTNILEVAAEFHTNIDEFERYNITVEHHNREWRRRGAKDKVFDPLTGEMHAIPDSYVDPAYITSSSYPLPESIEEKKSFGPLAKARPSLHRKPVILTRYHLRINKINFTLSYVVYDKDHQVIYYNEVTHQDLSYLVKRSVQEIWGNPFIYGDSGSVLEGISALIQGRKIPLCKNRNTRPVILDNTEEIKDSNTELKAKEVQQKALTSFEEFFRVWVPTIAGIAFVIHSLVCLMGAFGDRHHSTAGSFIVGALITGVVLVVSFRISYYMDRKISQIDAEKRFI